MCTGGCHRSLAKCSASGDATGSCCCSRWSGFCCTRNSCFSALLLLLLCCWSRVHLLFSQMPCFQPCAVRVVHAEPAGSFSVARKAAAPLLSPSTRRQASCCQNLSSRQLMVTALAELSTGKQKPRTRLDVLWNSQGASGSKPAQASVLALTREGKRRAE